MPIDEDALQSRMGLIGQIMFGPDYRQPFSEPLDQNTWLPNPKGARFTTDSRYITEDVPVGCIGSISFAEMFNIDTPVIHTMTQLSNIISGTDYYKTGFNLKTLGLDDLSTEEIVEYMRTGKESQ